MLPVLKCTGKADIIRNTNKEHEMLHKSKSIWTVLTQQLLTIVAFNINLLTYSLMIPIYK